MPVGLLWWASGSNSCTRCALVPRKPSNPPYQMIDRPVLETSSVWNASPRSDLALVGVVLVLTAALGWLGAFAIPRSADPTTTADAIADWLVASAFADGIDPHSNLRELADHYQVEFWDTDQGVDRVLKSPRTPGALILLYPLSWVPADQAVTAMLLVGLLSIAIAMIALAKTFELPWITICLGIAYATVSGPARWSHLFGTQEPFLLLCVAVFLVLVARADNPWSGIWIGVAGSLKVFPLVLLAVLIGRRRTKGLVAALATLGVLNLTPLLLPHVSLNSTVEAITSTASNWFDLEANVGLAGSLGRVLPIDSSTALWVGALLVAGAWFLVLRRPGPLGVSSGFLVCMGILALPFAWPHYLFVALPPVIIALHEEWLSRLQVGLAMGAIAMTVPLRLIALHTAGLVVMAVLLGFSLGDRRRRGSETSSPASVVGTA